MSDEISDLQDGDIIHVTDDEGGEDVGFVWKDEETGELRYHGVCWPSFGQPSPLSHLEDWEIKKIGRSANTVNLEIERLQFCCSSQNQNVCQTLGKALGYPWFKDDQENFPGSTEEHGVCVGDHVAESIAEEAAKKILQIPFPYTTGSPVQAGEVKAGWYVIEKGGYFRAVEFKRCNYGGGFHCHVPDTWHPAESLIKMGWTIHPILSPAQTEEREKSLKKRIAALEVEVARLKDANEDAYEKVSSWIREAPNQFIDQDQFRAGRTTGWWNVHDLLLELKQGICPRRIKQMEVSDEAD